MGWLILLVSFASSAVYAGGFFDKLKSKEGGKSEIPMLGNAEDLPRKAYEKYFEHVAKGVVMQALPAALQVKLKPFYKNSLAEILVGESANVSGDYAMTDCTKIYFPKGKNISKDIAAGTLKERLYWLLHELSHSEQCVSLGGRAKYAQAWFKNLSSAVVGTIMQGSIPSSQDIHTQMVLEQEAKKKANELYEKVKG